MLGNYIVALIEKSDETWDTTDTSTAMDTYNKGKDSTGVMLVMMKGDVGKVAKRLQTLAHKLMEASEG